MLFVYGGIAAGLSLGEPGSSPGLDGRQKSSRDLSFLAAEAFFSEGSAFPLWLNRNERACTRQDKHRGQPIGYRIHTNRGHL